MPSDSPLKRSSLLEVIVCSEADAIAAADGGADRLEVISRYDVGGLTPPLELVRRLAASVCLPLRVMVRQSESFAVSDPREIESLCDAGRAFADMGVDGLVLGFLLETPRGKAIDHGLLERILKCAPHVNATFHRAFEDLNDHLSAVAELKRHPQIDRILTSVGAGTQGDVIERLTRWQEAARPELELVIGGGTDRGTIRLLKPIGIREFHVGRAVRVAGRLDGAVLADRVRELSKLAHDG
jgi:copper homeostasis protein